MAQIQMNPEEVQEYSIAVLNNVKTMHEELDRLVTAFNDLDQIWVSQEKTVVRNAALKDINRLREVLVSFESFGGTALDIANRRVERENSFTNAGYME